ncbi:MAG: hypothetical protein RMJ48_06565 [Roseiflexaceae bacterium]|nr:hypothetical protein [Roseiflexaceae bacterium]
MRIDRHSCWAILLALVLALPVFSATSLNVVGDVSTIASQATQPLQATSASLYLPLITRPSPHVNEWSQHAHDAQRTGYTPQTVPYPWRWRWAWNGPDARGGIAKVTTGGSLPRNVQPVTGGGRVYIAAGVDGVFALSEADGRQLWQRSGIGIITSTVAYDRDTESVFAVAVDQARSPANG